MVLLLNLPPKHRKCNPRHEVPSGKSTSDEKTEQRSG